MTINQLTVGTLGIPLTYVVSLAFCQNYHDWHICRQGGAQHSCLLCLHWRHECTCFSVKTSTIKLTPDVSWCDRVDPDSSLHADMQLMREKEGFDHILFNFTFKVSSAGCRSTLHSESSWLFLSECCIVSCCPASYYSSTVLTRSDD